MLPSQELCWILLAVSALFFQDSSSVPVAYSSLEPSKADTSTKAAIDPGHVLSDPHVDGLKVPYGGLSSKTFQDESTSQDFRQFLAVPPSTTTTTINGPSGPSDHQKRDHTQVPNPTHSLNSGHSGLKTFQDESASQDFRQFLAVPPSTTTTTINGPSGPSDHQKRDHTQVPNTDSPSIKSVDNQADSTSQPTHTLENHGSSRTDKDVSQAMDPTQLDPNPAKILLTGPDNTDIHSLGPDQVRPLSNTKSKTISLTAGIQVQSIDPLNSTSSLNPPHSSTSISSPTGDIHNQTTKDHSLGHDEDENDADQLKSLKPKDSKTLVKEFRLSDGIQIEFITPSEGVKSSTPNLKTDSNPNMLSGLNSQIEPNQEHKTVSPTSDNSNHHSFDHSDADLQSKSHGAENGVQDKKTGSISEDHVKSTSHDKDLSELSSEVNKALDNLGAYAIRIHTEQIKILLSISKVSRTNA